MADNDKEAFRLGFLTRCAEEGLTGEKLEARLAAAATVTKQSSAAAGLGLLLGVPIAAGLAGGGAIGYGLAKAHEPPLDEDEIKAQEIANTYRVFAERAKARRKLREYRAAPPRALSHSHY